MATTEIEKLERRYAENPQGLTFAPLAEVHRKNGDIPRALELLRAGLELHPNYIPASIVLGRCHWDLGDLPAAEAAFSHVLRLDDENVIALKSLADINERLERFGDAQRWLNRLISVDRSNEEARQQLARVEAAKQGSGKTLAPAPATATVDPEPPPVASPAPPEASLEQLTEVATPPVASEPKPPVLEFIDTSQPAGRATEPPPPKPTEQPVHELTEPAPVEGLISQEFVPPKESAYRSHPELTQEFISVEEPAERLEVETAGEVELHSSGASEFRVPNAAEDFMEAAAHPPPAAELDLIRPEVVPQRTPTPTPGPKRPSYSVRETAGQSVGAFFRTMLAARPPAGANASAAAHVPEPEQTQEERGQSPPAGKEQSSPTVPASAGAPDLAVSFDDFFGAPAGGSGAQPQGSTDPGKDDLDQFQNWLQNLKR